MVGGFGCEKKTYARAVLKYFLGEDKNGLKGFNGNNRVAEQNQKKTYARAVLKYFLGEDKNRLKGFNGINRVAEQNQRSKQTVQLN